MWRLLLALLCFPVEAQEVIPGVDDAVPADLYMSMEHARAKYLGQVVRHDICKGIATMLTEAPSSEGEKVYFYCEPKVVVTGILDGERENAFFNKIQGKDRDGRPIGERKPLAGR